MLTGNKNTDYEVEMHQSDVTTSKLRLKCCITWTIITWGICVKLINILENCAEMMCFG